MPNHASSWLLFLMPMVCAIGQTPEPVPEAATLQSEFDTLQTKFNQEYTEASKKNDKDALTRLQANRPEKVMAPRFEAAAAAFADQEQAVPYLVWLVQRGDAKKAKVAMGTLMDKHIESPGIRLAVARIGGLRDQFGVQQSRDWLDRVLLRNHDVDVQAQAHFTRAAMYVGTNATKTNAELRQAAIVDLQAVVAAKANESLVGLATALLDEAQRLEPGLVAPEIEGEDLDGHAFKLSDYRGKVVMLDFWGDW